MEIESAELRNALNSINFDASSYKVLDVWIIITIVIGLSVLAATLIVFGTSDTDPNLTPGKVKGLIIFDYLFLFAILVAFRSYIQNIGTYIYGRIKPFDIKNPRA